MSARRIPLAMVASSRELMRLAEIQMEATALDTLETCVKDAKNAVHQTQSKVEELVKSIDEINDAKKATKLK